MRSLLLFLYLKINRLPYLITLNLIVSLIDTVSKIIYYKTLFKPITMKLFVVRIVIFMLASLVQSLTLGSKAIPVIPRSGKAFPKCTPGHYTCSGPFKFPVELNSILACNSLGN